MAINLFADEMPSGQQLGQQAAQDAGVKPVAAPPVPQLPQMASQPQAPVITPSAPVAQSAPAAREPVNLFADEVAKGSFTEPNINPPDRSGAQEAYDMNRGAPNYAAEHRTDDENAYTAKLNSVGLALHGQKFDPKVGMEDFRHADALAGIDSATDRVNYLRKNGYDASQISVPGVGPMTVFKKPDEDTWHPINGQEWSMGDAGRAFHATPQVATQVATTLLTGGASLPLRLAAQGLSGAGEKTIEQLFNKQSGDNTDSLGENAKAAGGAGAQSMIGEMIGSILGYGKTTAIGKQRASQPLSAEGLDVKAAADRLTAANPDIPYVTPGVGSEALALREKQLAPLSVRLQDRYSQFQQAMLDAINNTGKKLTGGAEPAVSNKDIGDVKLGMQNDAASLVDHIPEVSATQGGRSIADLYNNAIGSLVGRTRDKYGAVLEGMTRSAENPGGTPVNLAPTQAVAAAEAAPKFGQGVPANVETEVPVMGKGGLGETVQLGTKTESAVQPTEVKVGGGISPSIADKVKALLGLNPQLGTGPMTDRTLSPYEALQPIRSVLSEKSVYNPLAPGADRATSAQAGRILNPLDEAIDEASGAGGIAARKSKSFQTQILDNPQAVGARDALANNNPEANMKLANPANESFLKGTQRLAAATGQDAKYETFVNALKTQLKNDPQKLASIMEQAKTNPKGAARLLGSDAEPLQQYSDLMGRIEGGPVGKMFAEKGVANRPAIALASEDAPAIADLITRSGGQNGPIGTNLRAAVFKRLADASQKLGKPDSRMLAKNIDEVMQNPATKEILSGEEMQFLDDMRKVNKAQGDVMGEGMASSLSAASRTEGIGSIGFTLIKPLVALRNYGKRLEARIQGANYASDWGRRHILGGEVQPENTLAERIGGMMGTDYQADAPESRYNKSSLRNKNSEPAITPGR